MIHHQYHVPSHHEYHTVLNVLLTLCLIRIFSRLAHQFQELQRHRPAARDFGQHPVQRVVPPAAHHRRPLLGRHHGIQWSHVGTPSECSIPSQPTPGAALIGIWRSKNWKITYDYNLWLHYIVSNLLKFMYSSFKCPLHFTLHSSLPHHQTHIFTYFYGLMTWVLLWLTPFLSFSCGKTQRHIALLLKQWCRCRTEFSWTSSTMTVTGLTLVGSWWYKLRCTAKIAKGHASYPAKGSQKSSRINSCIAYTVHNRPSVYIWMTIHQFEAIQQLKCQNPHPWPMNSMGCKAMGKMWHFIG